MNFYKTLIVFFFTLQVIATHLLAQQADCYELIADFLEKEDYNNLLTAADICITLHSDDASLYKTKAAALSKLGRDYDALACLNEGILKNPENPAFLILRANQYSSTGYFDLSIIDNLEALKYVNNNDSLKAKVLSNLASANLNKRDHKAAITYYQAALDVEPNNLELLNNIAAAHHGLNNQELALSFYQKALTIDSLYIPALTSIGFLYAHQEDYKNAIKYINKSIDLEPNEPLNYNNRGFVKYKLGQLDEAEKDVNYALSLYPENAYAYRNKALILLAKQQQEQACEMMAQAIYFGFTAMYGAEVQGLIEEHCK